MFVCLWCSCVCLRAGGRGMCDPDMSLRVRTLPFVITRDTAMGLWTTGRVVLMRACLCVVCVVCCRGRALALVVTTGQRRSTWLTRPYGCHCCGPCLTKLLCSTGWWWLCPSQGQGAGLSFATHRLAGGSRLSCTPSSPTYGVPGSRCTSRPRVPSWLACTLVGKHVLLPVGLACLPTFPCSGVCDTLDGLALLLSNITYPEPELLSDDAINVDSEPAPPMPPAVPAALYLDGPPGQEWGEHVGLLDGEWELEAPPPSEL